MKTVITAFGFLILLCGGLSCDKGSGGNISAGANPAGQGGSLARFTIVGNYLYTVDKQNLKVFLISDAANPVLKNTVAAGFDIETIYPFKDKLFLGSSTAVYIYSIDNPEQPAKLSTAISPSVLRRCDPVVAKDSVAYATLRTSGPCGGVQSILAVYDVKDIINPKEVNKVLLSEPYGLGYTGNALFVCTGNSLVVFDITNQYQPNIVKQITGNAFVDVIPYGNTLICWVRDGIVLYDISNKFNPVFISKII
jgi:hypothetical protein